MRAAVEFFVGVVLTCTVIMLALFFLIVGCIWARNYLDMQSYIECKQAVGGDECARILGPNYGGSQCKDK